MARFDIAVIGGDKRSAYMVQLLEKKGYRLICCGVPDLEETADGCSYQAAGSLREAMEGADILVGGIPFVKENRLCREERLADMRIDNFNRHLEKRHILFAGVIPQTAKQACREKGAVCYDFMQDEAVAIFNAIATAEGALMEAVRAKQTNLHASKSLVLGYGRCGRVMADKLKGLSAEVTVCCRNEEALAYADAYGMKTLPLQKLGQEIGEFEYVFNTIPKKVLLPELLGRMDRDALIIDIASGAGGVDYEAAAAVGIRAMLCPGLPGKYAAKASAGRLAEYVIQRAFDSEKQEQ